MAAVRTPSRSRSARGGLRVGPHPRDSTAQQLLPRSAPGEQRLPVWGTPLAPQGCTSQWKVCPHQAGALRGTSAPLEPSPRVILDVGGFQVSGSFFSSCVLCWGCAGSWLLHASLSLVAVPQVLTAVTSLAAELSLGHGGAQALLPCGLWDLPGPRIRPAPLASQSGFLTTALPGPPFMTVLHPQPPG